MVSLLQQVYFEAPRQQETFERVRKVASDRVQLLRRVEEIMEHGRSEQGEAQVVQHMRKLQLELSPLDSRLALSAERNNISHQLVKLAFSGEEERKQFLLKTETFLFGAVVKGALK